MSDAELRQVAFPDLNYEREGNDGADEECVGSYSLT